MSTKHLMKKATLSGMENWKGMHVGHVSCHRDKKRHAQYRWGMKKGLRRARRRLDEGIIEAQINGE